MNVARFQRSFIREWREYRGLSLEALAQSIGMGKGNLSKIERAINPYTQGNLEKLAAALDCTPSDLLSRAPGEATALETMIAAATPDQRSQIALVAEALLQWQPAPANPATELERITSEIAASAKSRRQPVKKRSAG